MNPRRAKTRQRIHVETIPDQCIKNTGVTRGKTIDIGQLPVNAILNHSPICVRDKYAQTAQVLLVSTSRRNIGDKAATGKKVLWAHSDDHTGGVEIAEFPESLTVALGNDLRVRLLRINMRFPVIDSLA